MANFDDDTIVQIKINRSTPDGQFNDAIYMTKAEFDASDPEDIKAMKQARVDAWRAAIAQAKLPKPPKLKQELKDEKDELLIQKQQLQERIDTLTELILVA